MKSLSNTFLIIFLIVALLGCDKRSLEEKIMDKALENVINTMKNSYGLKYVGKSEAGEKNQYKKIGLSFQIFRILSKDEGRKILVNGVEEMLKQINSNSALLHYLKPSPFTFVNIEIDVFVYPPDRQKTYFPDILVFSMNRGVVKFVTKNKDTEFGLNMSDIESYEEAFKIVHTQEKFSESSSLKHS